MNNTKVRFKKTENANYIGDSTPKYGSLCAAGADLVAAVPANISIAPKETVMIPTGVALEIPDGLVGLVYARSGLACKSDLAPANKVGVIDSDYRGEVMVALHNHGDITRVIQPGERIAQLILTPYVCARFEESESLGETQRGSGGFGSTGKN